MYSQSPTASVSLAFVVCSPYYRPTSMISHVRNSLLSPFPPSHPQPILVHFGRNSNPRHFIGTNMRPGLWSTAEGGIGVMSANLPSLRPLFSRTAGVKPRSGPSVPSSGKNDMHNASGSLSMQGFCSGSKAFEQVGDSHSCHSFADAVNEAAPMQVTWNETHLETEIPLKCITVTTDIEQKIESQRDD